MKEKADQVVNDAPPPPDPALAQPIVATLLPDRGKTPTMIRRKEAGRLLLDWLNENGGFVQGEDASLYYFFRDYRRLYDLASQQWTAWKVLVRNGGPLPPTGAPVVPTLPASVTAVAPGIEGRFRKLIQDIKAKPAYNEAIGKALDIEGGVLTPPDLTSIQPEFTVTITGGQVFIGWGWNGCADWVDAIELQVDRGDSKGFALLAQDTTPGYTDTAPFPATPTKWTYRAIFLLEDARVGQWSKPVTVLVG